MKRRLFNILAALSLVLFLLSLAVWIISQWREQGVVYVHLKPDGQNWICFQLIWNNGSLGFVRYDPPMAPANTLAVPFPSLPGLSWYSKPASYTSLAFPSISIWNELGFVYSNANMPGSSGSIQAIKVPLYIFPILFALLPLMLLYHRWTSSVKAGHCPTCGYDLRATPQRCPECGTVPATEAKA